MSEYPVEAILDKKYKTIPMTGKSKAYYYIRWHGYGDDENTWEPIENLTGCKKLISEFEKKNNEQKISSEVPASIASSSNGRPKRSHDDSNDTSAILTNIYTNSRLKSIQKSLNEAEPFFASQKPQSNIIQDDNIQTPVPQLVPLLSDTPEYLIKIQKLQSKICKCGAKITKTKNIQSCIDSFICFKIVFGDKTEEWETLRTIKRLNIAPLVHQFILIYMRKKPEKVTEKFIKYFEVNLGITINQKPTAAQRAVRKEFDEDKEWGRIQDKSIPHFDVWRKLISGTRHPWPLIQNTVDDQGPPPNFKWTHDNIDLSGNAQQDNSDFLIGCDCFGTDCSSKSCTCSEGWGLDFAYGTHGRIKQNFTGKAIVECNEKCNCSEKCPNRVVQKHRQLRFAIFRCDNNKGWGVKALETIQAGTFIDEYVGEIITTEEADIRGVKDQLRGITYLFDLDGFISKEEEEYEETKFVLDANYYGNMTHFLNHSCSPNSVCYPIMIDNVDRFMHRLAFFAKKKINAGEEITFDYSGCYNDDAFVTRKPVRGKEKTGVLNFEKKPSNDVSQYFRCLCGSKNCKGYIKFRD